MQDWGNRFAPGAFSITYLRLPRPKLYLGDRTANRCWKVDAEISRCPRPSKPESPPDDAAAARNKSDDAPPELDGAGEPYAAQAMHSTIATELTNMTAGVRST
ncbi:hypothetical protein pipiens_007747 [Culex pipiens pipiens]|uniref:Uncharacterized protein n=1 Tax=Culex pipiens pipiens TaxID=38569 RepID=A0ABD1DKE5_CULPP